MNNQKLEAMLAQLRNKKDSDVAHQLLQELQNAIVILPAVMPANTDPAVLRQMKKAAKSGQEAALPKEANPIPCILEDNDKKKLIPVFTSLQELEKDNVGKQFPVRLNLSFQRCVRFLKQTSDVRTIVVNPFSHNFRIEYNIEKTGSKEAQTAQQEAQITEPQFHALVRQQIEAHHMPKRLFEESDAFIQEITKGGEKAVLKLFEPAYTRDYRCPYTAEDFDVLSLRIRDNLKIVQITLPSRHLYPGICSKVFLVMNPQTQETAYYAIVLRKDGHKILHQAFADGTNRPIGEAPPEGSELQAVIALY